MDLDPPPSSTPRKVKFAPKGPPRRPPKPKIEAASLGEDLGGDDELLNQSLSQRVQEHLSRRGPKAEKKSSVQVAFSHGVAASTGIRTFGKPRDSTDDTNNAASAKESASQNRQNLVTSTSSTVGEGEVSEISSSISNALVLKKRRAYREPWDYHHSYYPATLPWRRPYSGDPEILDEAEFGKAQEYDEETLRSASDLGLLDQDDKPSMLFMQFPACLPLANQQTTAVSKGKEIAGSTPMVSGTSSAGIKGKQVAGSSMMSGHGHPSIEGCPLKDLPEGYMGKMLVYKSGAVKLKLGDFLYDVSPGSDVVCAQSVAAVNTISRHCCDLGELNKRAVVTPDTDSLVDH